MSEEVTADSNVETKRVSVTVEMDVRVPTDDNSLAFDPLSQDLAEGSLQSEYADTDVTVKATRVRNDTTTDILTEFVVPYSTDPIGVFVPTSEIIGSAIDAVEETDVVELPEADA